MALNFINVPSQAWIGTVSSQSTFLASLPPSPGFAGIHSKIVVIPIDWRLYPVFTLGDANYGVQVNMYTANAVTRLDRIQSIYIDNIGNPTPVYVWFPDTGFTAICPAQAAGWTPVITNQLKAHIYGLGFINGAVRQTTVYFCPFFVPPSGLLSIAGGVDPSPLASVEAVWRHSEWIDAALVGANPYSVTFQNVPVGTGFAGRRILVMANGFGVNTISILTATIDAAPMVEVDGMQFDGSLAGNAFILALDAGDTLDIGIAGVEAQSGTSIGIEVYTLANLLQDQPTAIAKASSSAFSQAVNISVPARGGLIVSSMYKGSDGMQSPFTPPVVNGVPVDNINTLLISGSPFRRAAMFGGSDGFVLAANNWPISVTWPINVNPLTPRGSNLMACAFSPVAS